MVQSCKHDGRLKARLVAGGHLTDTPINSVHSSMVSLHGIRLLAFLGKLNEMDLWSTGVGDACL